MSGLILPQKLVSQLIEAVKTGILLADNQGTIRFTNEYLGALLEYPKDSLIGKPLQDLFFPEDVPVFIVNIMHLPLKDKGFEGEILLRKGDKSSLLVKLSTARYQEDSPEWDILIFTLQDISRFKQQEILQALALLQKANRSRIRIPSLELLPEATLYGDPGLLAQAVHYLLLNSLEASSDQDEIEVSGAFRDNQVIIEVKDRGEGVLPEQLPFVFDPFFSTKFNYLGLA